MDLASMIAGSVFNSHPHKEDDETFFQLRSVVLTFQLTSSQGG